MWGSDRGLPLQTPERFATTIALVRTASRIGGVGCQLRLPTRAAALQRKIRRDDLPSQRERLAGCCRRPTEASPGDWLHRHRHGPFLPLPGGPSLQRRQAKERLHRNFQGYTTGG